MPWLYITIFSCTPDETSGNYSRVAIKTSLVFAGMLTYSSTTNNMHVTGVASGLQLEKCGHNIKLTYVKLVATI